MMLSCQAIRKTQDSFKEQGDVVTKKQLVLLKDIAERFEFDSESFRLMLELIAKAKRQFTH